MVARSRFKICRPSGVWVQVPLPPPLTYIYIIIDEPNEEDWQSWLNAAVLKTADSRNGSVGSNPTSSSSIALSSSGRTSAFDVEDLGSNPSRASKIGTNMKATHTNYKHPNHLRVETGQKYPAFSVAKGNYEEDALCVAPSSDLHKQLNKSSLPSWKG